MASKAERMPVGTLWEIAPGKTVEVVTPDGETVTVSSGVYVLDVPGEYVSGDQRAVAE